MNMENWRDWDGGRFPQFRVKPYANIPRSKMGQFDPADDCCICGRRLTRRGVTGYGAAGQAYVASGGSEWAKTGDGPESPSWMGAHYVGTECWRKYFTHDVPAAK